MRNLNPDARCHPVCGRFGHAVLVGLAIALLAGGCSTLDPLNVRGLGKPPIRVAVARYEFAPTLFFLPKWSLLNDDLAQYLKEPVAFQLMTPRQIRVHMGTGRFKFALLAPEDYCEVASEDNHRILAVPADARGQTHRRGMIVVGAKSPIHSLSELEGQRFHFLMEGDVLNEAALGALLEAGVVQTDLDKGILGLGLDTHHISSSEVVKSVVLEGKGAGVIDEADYEQWGKTDGLLVSPVPLPSQDQVRVIGRTVQVPNGPFLVSVHTSPELTDKVREYLLNVVSDRKLKSGLVLGPMGYSRFVEPIDRSEYEPFFEIHRKLHPPEPQEGAGDDTAASSADSGSQ